MKHKKKEWKKILFVTVKDSLDLFHVRLNWFYSEFRSELMMIVASDLNAFHLSPSSHS